MTANTYAMGTIESIHHRREPEHHSMPHPTGQFARPSLLTTHIALTWYAGWWAYVLAQPGEILSIGASYRLFPAVMPEASWTVCFAVAAALGIVGIFWNAMRLPSTALLVVLHGTVAGLFSCAGGLNTGMGIYAGIAAQAFATLIIEHRRFARMHDDR
jgi:hypothetical protein